MDDIKQVGEVPVAWVHEEDSARVISARQKASALRDQGASASSVRPYSVPAFLKIEPAQGIDLGQLRSQVLGLTRRVEPISGQRFSYVQLDDVLALIDQRDAAPGVGNG